jgi:tRNA(Ile)-lysidine synthetase-like protein
MKQENDALLEQIKQYHLQISSAFSFIRETTKSLINSNFVIHLESFKTAHPSVQDDMIAYLIEQSSTSFTYETVQQIKRILLSKKPNQNYTLSKALSFVKVYDKALIKPFNEVKPFKIPLKEGMNKLQNMAIFTFFLNSNSNTAEFTKLCYNELAFPLWIRHREDGDLLAYEFGHKKLKKLLIDLKVPMEERDHLWVLTDNNNQILWVEKHYLNQTLGNQQTAYIELKGDQKHAS